jgi:hypothetical protein
MELALKQAVIFGFRLVKTSQFKMMVGDDFSPMGIKSSLGNM